MYSASFLNAVNNTLLYEGGYANNPSDPGGETNFGISKASYPTLNIQTLTRDQAIAIYHSDFWNVIQGESIPPKLALNVFDCAVNMGSKTSTIMLQSALGVAADGIIGPITRAALSTCDVHRVLEQFTTARILKYAALSTFKTFGTSWIDRTIGTLLTSTC